jgi:hypothetical protein
MKFKSLGVISIALLFFSCQQDVDEEKVKGKFTFNSEVLTKVELKYPHDSNIFEYEVVGNDKLVDVDVSENTIWYQFTAEPGFFYSIIDEQYASNTGSFISIDCYHENRQDTFFTSYKAYDLNGPKVIRVNEKEKVFMKIRPSRNIRFSQFSAGTSWFKKSSVDTLIKDSLERFELSSNFIYVYKFDAIQGHDYQLAFSSPYGLSHVLANVRATAFRGDTDATYFKEVLVADIDDLGTPNEVVFTALEDETIYVAFQASSSYNDRPCKVMLTEL